MGNMAGEGRDGRRYEMAELPLHPQLSKNYLNQTLKLETSYL
jgi:hypothetical protein